MYTVNVKIIDRGNELGEVEVPVCSPFSPLVDIWEGLRRHLSEYVLARIEDLGDHYELHIVPRALPEAV